MEPIAWLDQHSPAGPSTLLLVGVEPAGSLYGHELEIGASLDYVGEVLESHWGRPSMGRVGAARLAILFRGDMQTTRRMLGQLPTMLAEEQLGGAVHVGVTQRPAEEGTEEWLARAEAALREAGRTGATHVVYDDVAQYVYPVTPAAIDAVREMLANPRSGVVYQPIIDLQTRLPLGYEAFTRPDVRFGLGGPGPALAAAARIGRASALDQLFQAGIFEDGPGFDMGRNELLFVNITAAALQDRALDLQRVVSDVRAAGLVPERVVWEISARARMSGDLIAAHAKRLLDCGFRLALDDVGSGWAGLHLLRTVPVHYIKLHPVLISAAVQQPRAWALLHGLCAFAAEADVRVIAEGVEDVDLHAFVGRLGVPHPDRPFLHAAQGYHLGRPRPRPRMSEEAPPNDV